MTVDLLDYGATEDLVSLYHELGRIIRVDRGECDVISKKGIVRAVSDSNRSQGAVAPVTGDWVRLADIPEIGTVIEEVLPRKNKLSRRDPSDERVEQVLVSNLDLVMIVHGIDRPLPPGRIERLLTLAWSSRSQVIVVLTKVEERDELLEETMQTIKAIAPGVLTLTVDSANASDSGLEEIKQMLKRGHTAALIGESGAGKSSLANALLGGEILETGEVRPGDKRGRHTTVTREMLLCPDGGLLVDTPGLRSVGIWDAKESLEKVFADLEKRSKDCRFSNCMHDSEPDCAVIGDVLKGLVDERRLTRYRALLKELSDQQTKTSKRKNR
ncbi:MAG: Small ribosomal subunit biogenesis GTPase RsgA [Acidimicrobiaceae bacterium]|jgi:ribosome biogenesis GTPase|nr:ribosome small subunit-dependent GTPase A [Acidimicrobiaceae bacterium]CAI8361976.1 MAG: Small ribosomal subunit biogenesis GTPase RsgA [Acidimicrobiaceae bacterium]|tara:strand:- start:307 stop:1290 length:984 start_codon:yes stop_codon:yes gene_type:complete